jgi:hypothetical protein
VINILVNIGPAPFISWASLIKSCYISLVLICTWPYLDLEFRLLLNRTFSLMQLPTWTLYPQWSDTRHLFDTWETNRGPEFDTFSPGTEYHFARNLFFPQVWRLRAHHFFPVVKERPGIRHQCYWLQISIIHVELVLWTFLETGMAISFQ